MITTATRPTTVRQLLEALLPYQPALDGPDLVFLDDPPAGLVPAIRLLQTGLRAMLAARPWYGMDPHGRAASRRGRDGGLNPSRPLPRSVAFLCVAGDPCWDRVPASARAELPHLFEPEPAAREKE
jgi:hypothetical protein